MIVERRNSYSAVQKLSDYGVYLLMGEDEIAHYHDVFAHRLEGKPGA